LFLSQEWDTTKLNDRKTGKQPILKKPVAPGLDFETWDTTELNSGSFKKCPVPHPSLFSSEGRDTTKLNHRSFEKARPSTIWVPYHRNLSWYAKVNDEW
jgi:hypothetical protein